MTDQNTNNSDARVELDEQALQSSPGEKLKKLREELGYSREKISAALRITVHYVKSLEEDEYGKLPGKTFTKGYLKSYATFLGADVEEILKCYINLTKAEKESAEQEAKTLESQDNKKLLAWIALGIVVVALLIFLVIWMTSDANAQQISQNMAASTLTTFI